MKLNRISVKVADIGSRHIRSQVHSPDGCEVWADVSRLTAYTAPMKRIALSAVALSLFCQIAQAQSYSGQMGMRPDLQAGIVVCWISFALALAYGQYRYNEPLAGKSAFIGLLAYVGGGLGAMLLYGAFTSIFLQLLMPVLYLGGTYLLIKQLVPYRHRNK